MTKVTFGVHYYCFNFAHSHPSAEWKTGLFPGDNAASSSSYKALQPI